MSNKMKLISVIFLAGVSMLYAQNEVVAPRFPIITANANDTSNENKIIRSHLLEQLKINKISTDYLIFDEVNWINGSVLAIENGNRDPIKRKVCLVEGLAEGQSLEDVLKNGYSHYDVYQGELDLALSKELAQLIEDIVIGQRVLNNDEIKIPNDMLRYKAVICERISSSPSTIVCRLPDDFSGYFCDFLELLTKSIKNKEIKDDKLEGLVRSAHKKLININDLPMKSVQLYYVQKEAIEISPPDDKNPFEINHK
jgi:hypothetical protein